MDVSSDQADWVERFMYYLLFDLAMFGVVIIGYLSIKVLAMLIRKHSKNQSKYH
jgi:hypothetical protein